MRLSNKKIRKKLNVESGCNEKKMKETIRRSKAVFYECQAKELISSAEFLYQQSRYIRKFWWALQGALLLVLWFMLELTGGSAYERRCMGIAAPLFALLLLPELWKNRNVNALEIESAAYYSLRQIYAARMILFAFVDFLFLGIFFLAGISTGRLDAGELMIQFFLPYLVTCCICFRTLYSFRSGSEAFAILLCILWCVVWVQLVLQEQVYQAVSMPAWILTTGAAGLYLGYCIVRGQNHCLEIWEEKSERVKNFRS